MIEIKVNRKNKEVVITGFDGSKTYEFYGRDQRKNTCYWDILAEYCEYADKCGLVPQITVE